jgi:aryl-alcohol dehydrogenase-like predicted oxidoreductase
MRYRQLGSSNLRISEIGLGSWLTFGGGVAREQAVACMDAGFDAGITFIDTANVYGHGAAEEFLGEVLASRPRDSYVLATKLFFPMSDTDSGLSRAQILKQLDGSLTRLRTDHVDLYQCHRYDTATPLEETMRALTEVVEAGKVRYVGFSNWTAAQIQAALEMVPSGAVKFVSSQPQYSLLSRQPEEAVFPLCARNGIGQVVWSPLAQGVLTGKYRPGDRPPDDSRMASAEMGWAMGRYDSEELLERVQRLGPIADRLGITMAQLALAWVLRRPEVTSAIVGATRPEQVRDNAAASGVELDASTLAEIDSALG